MNGICQRCKQKLGNEASFAYGQLWHNSCFRCFKCDKSLIDEWFIKRKETKDILCFSCSKPICRGCRKPIDDERVKAAGSIWHRQCLKCDQCNDQLINEVRQVTYSVHNKCKRQ